MAVLAASIPTPGSRVVHAARPSVAGRPVKLRAAGGPAPAPLAAGGGALTAHASAPGCQAAGAGESEEAEGTPQRRP